MFGMTLLHQASSNNKDASQSKVGLGMTYDILPPKMSTRIASMCIRKASLKNG